MNFGEALEKLKQGLKLQRTGWNGSGMFVYYVPATTLETITKVGKKEFGCAIDSEAFFMIKTVRGTIATWVPSVNDCLAEDWQVVE